MGQQTAGRRLADSAGKTKRPAPDLPDRAEERIETPMPGHAAGFGGPNPMSAGP